MLRTYTLCSIKTSVSSESSRHQVVDGKGRLLDTRLWCVPLYQPLAMVCYHVSTCYHIIILQPLSYNISFYQNNRARYNTQWVGSEKLDPKNDCFCCHAVVYRVYKIFSELLLNQWKGLESYDEPIKWPVYLKMTFVIVIKDAANESGRYLICV